MPCPLSSNALTATASSATALSNVDAGRDANRIAKFQSGVTRNRSNATAPTAAAASNAGPGSTGCSIAPVAPKPSMRLNRKRGDVMSQNVRPAMPLVCA